MRSKHCQVPLLTFDSISVNSCFSSNVVLPTTLASRVLGIANRKRLKGQYVKYTGLTGHYIFFFCCCCSHLICHTASADFPDSPHLSYHTPFPTGLPDYILCPYRVVAGKLLVCQHWHIHVKVYIEHRL